MHFKKEHFQRNKSILKSIFFKDNYYRHSTLQLLSNSVLFIVKNKFLWLFFLLLQSYHKNKTYQIYCIKLFDIWGVFFLTIMLIWLMLVFSEGSPPSPVRRTRHLPPQGELAVETWSPWSRKSSRKSDKKWTRWNQKSLLVSQHCLW